MPQEPQNCQTRERAAKERIKNSKRENESLKTSAGVTVTAIEETPQQLNLEHAIRVKSEGGGSGDVETPSSDWNDWWVDTKPLSLPTGRTPSKSERRKGS